MIVLSESSEQLKPSSSVRDIQASTEAARIVGCRVYTIPPDFDACGTAEDALYHVPAQDGDTPCIWIGYIPEPERYAAVYEAALRKRIRLPNTPEQHLRVQEFDRAYSVLKELTPRSVILSDPSQCGAAVEALGLPVFVRGAVQSRKARGWKACVANSVEELTTLAKHLLALENRARGRVIVRTLVRLRHARMSAEGFPFGREYRVFVYKDVIVGSGYYWEGDDPLKDLTGDEERQVRALALEAAQRLAANYVAVDVGQLEDGQWIVIESGDGQFSGVSQTPLLSLWNALERSAEGSAARGST